MRVRVELQDQPGADQAEATHVGEPQDAGAAPDLDVAGTVPGGVDVAPGSAGIDTVDAGPPPQELLDALGEQPRAEADRDGLDAGPAPELD